jgi:hypothetical protein
MVMCLRTKGTIGAVGTRVLNVSGPLVPIISG